MIESFDVLACEQVTNRDLWLLAQVYYPFLAVPQNKTNSYWELILTDLMLNSYVL